MRNTELEEVASSTLQLICDGRSRETDILSLTLQGKTRKEIADEYGLTCERIRQLIKHGINILQARRNSYENMKARIGDLHYKLLQERMHSKYLEDVVKHYIRKTKRYYKEMPPTLLTRVVDTELPVRVKNGLRSLGVEYVWEVAMLRADDLIKVRSIGKKSVNEVRQFLISCGVDFNTDVEEKYGVSLRKA